MKQLTLIFFAALMCSLAVLACNGKSKMAISEISISSDCESFESVTPAMFEIHDTTVTYYQNYIKKLHQESTSKNRKKITIVCRGFKIDATVAESSITFTSRSYEDNSYLLFSGKGVLKPETVDLFYEVATPVSERPI